jgi:hypothetical protein
MTDRIEIIGKEIEGHTFTGLRFYLELPVTVRDYGAGTDNGESVRQVSGPFMHHDGDDDSAAVTFWGKRDLRDVLKKALELLDQHYEFTTIRERARAKGWTTPPPTGPLASIEMRDAWMRYWYACADHEAHPETGRPVAPHRSGGGDVPMHPALLGPST